MKNVIYSLAALLLAAGSPFLFSNQHQNLTMEKGKIVELVIYKVKADQAHNFSLIIDQVNEAVKTFDGFIARSVHQSPDDPTLLMDYVTWESLEQAKAAARHMQGLESMRPFMEAIEEIQTFTHFEIK
ncbi:MAG: antibiotic biosynthesis monooxygenase family protein [Bacteroidota bacterium]